MNIYCLVNLFRRALRTQSNIQDGAFWGNYALNYSRRKLHLRCLPEFRVNMSLLVFRGHSKIP